MGRTHSWLGITAGAQLALLVIFYWPFLSNTRSFYISDIALLQQPLDAFLAAAMYGGRLPLWNPYILAGMPTNAFMSPSPAYLFQFLFVLMPFSSAYATLLIVNHMAAFFGGYLLITAIGWGRRSAILFALSFALSSLLFSLQAVPTLMSVAAWLPLTAFALVKLHQQHEWRRRCLFCALLALAAYLMIGAGSLDVAAVSLCLLGAWTVRANLLSSESRNEKLIRLAMAIFGTALGLLLSMAQIVPLLEWATRSPRALGLGSQQVFDLSANWYDLLGLLLAHPLGDRSLADNPFLGITESYRNPNTYLPSAYVGPILLTFAFWGLCDRRWCLRWLLLIAAVLACIAALGDHTPVMPYLVSTFNVRLFRFPVKFLLFPVLILLGSAARGLSAFPEHVPAKIVTGGLVFWVVLFLTGACLMIPATQEPLIALVRQSPPVPIVRAAASEIGRSILFSALLGIAVSALAALVRQNKVTTPTFATLCTVATVGLFVWQSLAVLRHEAPPNFFATNIQLAEKLRSASVNRHGNVRFVSLTWAGHIPSAYLGGADQTVSYYNYARQILTPLANVDSSLGALGANQYINTLDNSILFDRAYQRYVNGDDLAIARYCQRTASEFVVDYDVESNASAFPVLHRALDRRYFTLVDVLHDLNCRIYKVNDPLPRAYFAVQCKWGQPHQAVVEYLSRTKDSTGDPHRLTVLEHARADQKGPFAGTLNAPGKIEWLKDEPEEIVLRAQTTSNNFLVLADTDYPGWTATVDGRAVEIFEANAFARAVFIPSGAHVVAFSYCPRSVIFGFGLSGLGILCLAMLVVAARRRAAAQGKFTSG